MTNPNLVTAENIDGFNKIRTVRIGTRVRVDCFRQDSAGEWQHVYGGEHPASAMTGVGQ